MQKIDKLNELLREHFVEEGSKEEAILNALQTIYGLEQGCIDYIGYSLSGTYKYDVDQALEFIEEKIEDNKNSFSMNQN